MLRRLLAQQQLLPAYAAATAADKAALTRLQLELSEAQKSLSSAQTNVNHVNSEREALKKTQKK